MNRISTNGAASVFLIGNSLPATVIVFHGAKKVFEKGDRMNLEESGTPGDDPNFRPGFYQIIEDEPARHGRCQCRRLSVHRIGDADESRPSHAVVILIAE